VNPLRTRFVEKRVRGLSGRNPDICLIVPYVEQA
jgi:hypothetical protein